jgi:hypothetical protein
MIALTGTIAWAASESSAATIRISALDCQFEFPTTYRVKVDDGYGIHLYSSNPTERGSFTFAPLSAPLSEGLPPPVSTMRKGALLVEHYAVSWAGAAESTKSFITRILGQSQQLVILGLPHEQAEKYVTQCLDTIDPAVVAVSQRRAKGCASELPLDVARQTLLGKATYQVVFSGGKLIGWRIYGIEAGSALARAGITQGGLLTDICGVPAEELLADPDSICCATDSSREITATFRSDRGPPKSVVVKRGT